MGRRGWLVLAAALAGVVLLPACTPAAPPTTTPPQPAPPITLVASTVTAGAKPTDVLRIGRPAAIAAGQVLVAQVSARHAGSTAALTPPDGWIQVGVTSRGSAKGGAGGKQPPRTEAFDSWVFVRVADDAEPEAYEFSAGTPAALAGALLAFSHVDAADPLSGFAGVVNPEARTLAGPAIHPNLGNTVAAWFGTQISTTKGCPEPRVSPPPGFRDTGTVCTDAPGLALGSGVRQLGAAASQPRFAGRTTTAAPSIVQVITLRPVGGFGGDRQVPLAQAPNTFAKAPASAPDGPDRYGTPLWSGLRPGKKKDTDLDPDVLYQPSGLAASRVDPSVLYAHSEKDRGTMVAIDNDTGEVLGRYTVTIPELFDWEDVAAGPCPAGNCLFAADTGQARDIAKPNKVYSVTRFLEPDLSGGQRTGTLSGDTFPFTYPGGVRRDAEALMVHPWTGQLYVITKSRDGKSEVFTFPSPLPDPGTPSELVKLATLELPTDPDDAEAAKVTAAAMHPVANRFLVRTYRHVYEFRGPEGAPFDEALNGTRVELTDTEEGQGESITYAIDGSAYYTLSEAPKPPFRLNRVDRSPGVAR